MSPKQLAKVKDALKAWDTRREQAGYEGWEFVCHDLMTGEIFTN
jgi:hypothetical protein